LSHQKWAIPIFFTFFGAQKINGAGLRHHGAGARFGVVDRPNDARDSRAGNEGAWDFLLWHMLGLPSGKLT